MRLRHTPAAVSQAPNRSGIRSADFAQGNIEILGVSNYNEKSRIHVLVSYGGGFRAGDVSPLIDDRPLSVKRA